MATIHFGHSIRAKFKNYAPCGKDICGGHFSFFYPKVAAHLNCRGITTLRQESTFRPQKVQRHAIVSDDR